MLRMKQRREESKWEVSGRVGCEVGTGRSVLKKKKKKKMGNVTKEGTIIGGVGCDGWGSPCLSLSQLNWLQLMRRVRWRSCPCRIWTLIEDRCM